MNKNATENVMGQEKCCVNQHFVIKIVIMNTKMFCNACYICCSNRCEFIEGI